ncbi:hypothetical protein PGB90_002238 [Kerria lacca]
MSTGTFVDRIDPFAKRSLKKKSKKSQGSSRYRTATDVELQQLPLLKGNRKFIHPLYCCTNHVYSGTVIQKELNESLRVTKASVVLRGEM